VQPQPALPFQVQGRIAGISDRENRPDFFLLRFIGISAKARVESNLICGPAQTAAAKKTRTSGAD